MIAVVSIILVVTHGCASVYKSSVVLFQPKYWLGHPEDYIFSLSKNMYSGSMNPISFTFENRSIASHTL